MDYAKGKIYSIRSHLTDDFYIGSTASTLSKRLYEHKKDNEQFIAGTIKWCCSSFQILNFGDAYIELLQEYPCENRNQLRRREGEFIRDNDCVNKNIAGRTKAEYYQDNKEKIAEYYQDNQDKINKKHKEWCQNNKQQIKEYNKEYSEKNKDKINKKHKEYYQNNKEKIDEYNKEYNKEYRIENKDKIKAFLNKKFVCECGGNYTNANKARHFKTLKHLNFVQVCVPKQDEGKEIGTEDI